MNRRNFLKAASAATTVLLAGALTSFGELKTGAPSLKTLDVGVTNKDGNESHVVYPMPRLVAEIPTEVMDECIKHILTEGHVIDGKLNLNMHYDGHETSFYIWEKYAKREDVLRFVLRQALRQIQHKIKQKSLVTV